MIYAILLVLSIAIILWLVYRLSRSVESPVHMALEREKIDLQMQLAASAERELHLEKRTLELTNSLEIERRERHELAIRSERANSFAQAQQQKQIEQAREIENVRTQLNNEFKLLASQILEDKSKRFTALNQENLGQLLDPLSDRIKLFEEKVDKTYQQEAAERNVLKGVVEQLMQQSQQIQNEANSLSRALKGDTKRQGNWGEVILEKVLERSGLTKDREYRLQISLHAEDGTRKQPDAIIDLPDEKHLIVDAKVSLTAYERWVDAESDSERQILVRQHIQSVENHVKDLSAKNYHELYGIDSPDFVLLFMPIESALSLAVTEKPELFSDAWDRKVVIVSPSTLLATLRTIASIWKQELQNRNVVEIAREAGKLYDKFVGFLGDLEQVQVHLSRAGEKHAEATKKLSTGPGNVVRRIENLKTLGAKANKQIDERYLND